MAEELVKKVLVMTECHKRRRANYLSVCVDKSPRDSKMVETSSSFNTSYICFSFYQPCIASITLPW